MPRLTEEQKRLVKFGDDSPGYFRVELAAPAVHFHVVGPLVQSNPCHNPPGPGGGQFCGGGASGAGGWKQVTSASEDGLKQATEQMKESVKGFDAIWVKDNPTAAEFKKMVDYVNVVGSETAHLTDGKFPGINNALKEREVLRYVSIDDKRMAEVFDRGIPVGVKACFENSYDMIHLRLGGGGIGKIDSDRITVGKWNSAPDAAGTFRHEFGHGLYKARSVLERGTGMSWGATWRTLGDKWFGKVSGYAKTNLEEAFCESFAAYTGKNYGAAGSKRLPSEVETYFNRVLREA